MGGLGRTGWWTTAAVVASVLLGGGAAAATKDRWWGDGSTGVKAAGRVGDQAPASGAPNASTSPSGSATTSPEPTWLSGAASDEAADGRYGAWRGTPIAIGGTWDNGNSEQVQMRSICTGSWTRWNKPLDIAIGAIDVEAGESWAAAARGAYDARWRRNLQKIKSCWGGRDQSDLFIRFAHEMNLNTMKWKVRGGEEADFVTAITRYSTLRYAIVPKARIVLCPNDGTQVPGLDIRKLWPGNDAAGRPVANLYAVDSYNMNPHVTSKSAFNKKINAAYGNGIPLGIEKHRQFAESKGVPFAISEWGNNGDPNNSGGGGESTLFVQQFYSWALAHAGDPANPTAGQLLYEVHFNLWGVYAFWPKTMQPRTAAAYRALSWGR